MHLRKGIGDKWSMCRVAQRSASAILLLRLLNFILWLVGSIEYSWAFNLGGITQQRSPALRGARPDLDCDCLHGIQNGARPSMHSTPQDMD